MSSKIIDNFDIRTNKPLDARSINSDVNSIEMKYEGLITYDSTDEDIKFYDKNGNWKSIYKDIVNSSVFENVMNHGANTDGVTDNLTAFNNAIATGKTIFIPKGNYYLSANTNKGSFILENGAVIIGLADINSNGTLMNDTSRLVGKIFSLSGKDGLFGLMVGSGNHWLERDIRKATEIIAEMSILSTSGQIGLVTATRSSDNPIANMSTIGHASYGVNDNIINKENSWALYLESRRSAGAGTTFDAESDFVNFGDTVDLIPYSNVTGDSGQTVCHWFSCGGGGVDGANNISSAIGIIPNPKQFKRGIVFVSGSLDTSILEAITLPNDYKIAWYDLGGLKGYLNGDGRYSIKGSDVLSDSIVDNIFKKKINTSLVTNALDIIKRDNFYGYSGSDNYLGAYTQAMQRTDFVTGNARFSYDISAKNTAGTVRQVSLNGIDNDSFAPSDDNALSLGLSYARWGQIYSGTSTISTSDVNLKQDINIIDDKLVEAFMSVEPKIFRFKDAVSTKGETARYHMGYIAQELESALIAQGLTPSNYAIWCKDAEMVLVKDSNGVATPQPTGNYRYSLRYEHFIALMEASNRKRFNEVNNKIASLETTIKQIQESISALQNK